MQKKINVAIIGTGNIGSDFGQAGVFSAWRIERNKKAGLTGQMTGQACI